MKHQIDTIVPSLSYEKMILQIVNRSKKVEEVSFIFSQRIKPFCINVSRQGKSPSKEIDLVIQSQRMSLLRSSISA